MQLHVRRWRKYGKDRLYLSTPDGHQVGWYDLNAGTTHADSPTDLPVITATITTWLAQHPQSPQPAPATPAPRTTPRAPGPEPTAIAPASTGPAGTSAPAVAPGAVATHAPPDLASHAPGQLALAQADAIAAAAPRRGLLVRLLRALFAVPGPDRSWRVGAHGEQLVGAELAGLTTTDPRWHALHAIPVGAGDSDIDHLVIGPGGIYTLNTKHHPRGRVWVASNAVMVNGAHVPYLRNSRHEAKRAATMLHRATGRPVTVHPLIVVITQNLTIKQQPADVTVLGRRKLTTWLTGQPATLDPGTITALYDAARRPSTWTPTVRP